MSTPEPIIVEPAPVFDLDPAALGAILIQIPATSSRVGHASLRATFGYGSAEDSGPEAQFIRDLFTLPTSEIIAKWYGSRANASRFAAEVFGRALARHRQARPNGDGHDDR